MVKIIITCPQCAKKGTVDVEENLVRNSKRGITAITVAEALICEHSFVAYIDKNLSVRDCYIADFQIELPQIELSVDDEEILIPPDDKVDIYLISINISSLSLASIIRACFHKKQILYINEIDALNRHMTHFFDFIFGETFKVDIFFTSQNDYRKNKKQYKNHVVINSNQVLNDKGNLLLPKKLKIENVMIQKFFSEANPQISLILLKNEINTTYQLCKKIIELNDNLKENETLNSKGMVNHFYKTLNVNIQLPYLRFLEEIVASYFNVELKKDNVATDFLGLL